MRPFGCPFVAAVLLALAAAPARAETQPPPPGDVSAIGEYVETVPSSGGGVASGVGKARSRPLPRSIAARVKARAGRLAPKLRAVATSSDYGAPQGTIRRAEERAPERSSLSAAVHVASEGNGVRDLVLLGAVLVLITAFALGVAARKRT